MPHARADSVAVLAGRPPTSRRQSALHLPASGGFDAGAAATAEVISHPRLRAPADRGSVTVWTLGMVLVVMFVGGISFDLWSGFATRRQYAAAADQAAQAGANALDQARYRSTGQRELDPQLARTLAADNLAAQQLRGVTNIAITANTDQVVVELTATVDVGLLRIFGGGDPLVVHVRAVGQPREATP